MTLTLEEATAKLAIVRQEAVQKFSRPVSIGCGTKKITDLRLIDYIYEVVFSVATMQVTGEKEKSLESARGLIFSLPDFKAAAERVAYSEDLLTRAVTLLEGMTRCRLCGSNNTTFTVRQMHSSDEAPTTMLFCGSCHHRTNQTGE